MSPGISNWSGYVIPREGSSPTAESLRQSLKQKAPANTWCRLILFFSIPSPLTQNGKVDRKALPAPSFEMFLRKGIRRAAHRNRESACGNLGAVVESGRRIGIHDDFFDFGGHSLMAMKLVSQSRKDLE